MMGVCAPLPSRRVDNTFRVVAAMQLPLRRRRKRPCRPAVAQILVVLAASVLFSNVHLATSFLPSLSLQERTITANHVLFATSAAAARTDTTRHRSTIRHDSARPSQHTCNKNGEFVIVRVYQVPSNGFSSTSKEWMQRPKPHLSPSPTNVTLPQSLMLLDPDLYPTMSKAKKAIRRGRILIQAKKDGGFNASLAFKGIVKSRVYPEMYVAQRKYVPKTGYPGLTYAKPWGVGLPVVYECHDFAMVNKPSGMICYSDSKGGFDNNSVKRIAPHVLTPPSNDKNALEWPSPVHRLDLATCGLLVVAKTKEASIDLANQFANRQVTKTYRAILNGIPKQENNTVDSKKNDRIMDYYKKRNLVGDTITQNSDWNVIDWDIDEKPAVTLWRPVSTAKCLLAANVTVTLVEFRPLHGRRHQLRRHAAVVLKCPIVGDKLYDDGSVGSVRLRPKGDFIYLCANSLVLEHPTAMTMDELEENKKHPNATITTNNGRVMVQARINVPEQFENFMRHEERRAEKFKKWMMRVGWSCLWDIYKLSKDYC